MRFLADESCDFAVVRALMRGKASLHKTLEEIQHEFTIREDMAVRPTAIDFLVRDHKIQPMIRDEAYDLTDHSQAQMLTRAGIPAQFAQKLMDLEERELLSKNLKRLTERMEDGGILLRRVGTTIKGWLSPAYKRMDAAPIMEAFLKRTPEKKSTLAANIVRKGHQRK